MANDLISRKALLAEYDRQHEGEPGKARKLIEDATAIDAMEVKQYETLLEMYNELRENFVDYVCSGTQNVAPYCLNKCNECVDKWGWCKQYSDHCKGFNPAECILEGERKGND